MNQNEMFEALRDSKDKIKQLCSIINTLKPNTVNVNDFTEVINEIMEDYDPSPWCSAGHRTAESCDCGPIPDND